MVIVFFIAADPTSSHRSRIDYYQHLQRDQRHQQHAGMNLTRVREEPRDSYAVQYTSVLCPVGSSRVHEEQFSRDPFQVFSAVSHQEQFLGRPGRPLLDIVHPAFPLPTTTPPNFQQPYQCSSNQQKKKKKREKNNQISQIIRFCTTPRDTRPSARRERQPKASPTPNRVCAARLQSGECQQRIKVARPGHDRRGS